MNIQAQGEAQMRRLLQTMVDQGASDLHLTVGAPPQFRVNGHLVPLRSGPLTPEGVKALIFSVLSEGQQRKFEEEMELDLSFSWDGNTRFRANFYRQKHAMAGAIRQIPNETKPLKSLGFPPQVEELAAKPHGLVLVTGPTGAGKSTTLASLIDVVNSTRRDHIITIEDPIEFVHDHKMCIVNQREVGSDTSGFQEALRYILRQDPDIVLIGEIRDHETMETALRIAETGHLVFATLHTNNAVQTVHRIIDFFPAYQQPMIRTQLSFVLEAVVSQQLIPKQDGKGRVLAYEILFATPAVRNLIREDKMHQVGTQMQIGRDKYGMVTLNQSLLSHVQTGAISREQAMELSYDSEELEGMFRHASVPQPSGTGSNG